MKRSLVRNIAAAVIAAALFIQTNIAGLPVSAEAKSWIMFGAGTMLAGLTVFKLREDDVVPLAQYNSVVEASSIAEYNRLKAEDAAAQEEPDVLR